MEVEAALNPSDPTWLRGLPLARPRLRTTLRLWPLWVALGNGAAGVTAGQWGHKESV